LWNPAGCGNTKVMDAHVAALPEVARVRTRYDEAGGAFRAKAQGHPDFEGGLADPAGCAALEAWLTAVLGEGARGTLKVVQAPGHRFTDHPLGHVSIVNLASVRDLEARLGRPLRFRANVYVEGWPAWAENDWTGRDLMVGFARARVFKPIVRCVATHVDLETGERDIDVVKALFDNYGHMHCGIYVHVTDGGRVALGDACTTPQEARAA
jgi:uncharacterized protein YcbX